MDSVVSYKNAVPVRKIIIQTNRTVEISVTTFYFGFLPPTDKFIRNIVNLRKDFRRFLIYYYAVDVPRNSDIVSSCTDVRDSKLVNETQARQYVTYQAVFSDDATTEFSLHLFNQQNFAIFK